MKQDQASRTAKFVSNGIYWVSRQPRLSVEVPPALSTYTEAMTRQINPQRLLGSAKLKQAVLLKKCQILQAASAPGIYLHQVLRKRCIESLARAVVAEGITLVETPQICSDGMSDRSFGMRATLIRHGDTTSLLSGCCRIARGRSRRAAGAEEAPR